MDDLIAVVLGNRDYGHGPDFLVSTERYVVISAMHVKGRVAKACTVGQALEPGVSVTCHLDDWVRELGQQEKSYDLEHACAHIALFSFLIYFC